MPCRRLVLAVFVVSVSVSCGGSPTTPDAMDLMGALQLQGVTVLRVEQMSRSSFPFFSVSAERWLVNGESVHAFQYFNDSSAERDARLVSPAGAAVGTTAVSWVDTPRFYKQSSVIVLYVGRTSEITRALGNVLGPPFAGGT